jgi:hypothetical protein
MAEGKYPTINLVGFKVNARALRRGYQQKLTGWGIWLLVGFLGVFIPTLFIRWSLVTKNDELEQDLANLTAKIEAMRPTETKYVLLTTKADAVAEVLANRVGIEPKLRQVYEIMPAGCQIGEVSFGKEEGQLVIMVKANDVFAAGQLISQVSQAVGSRFVKVTITSTKRDSQGIYNVAMELIFAKQT